MLLPRQQVFTALLFLLSSGSGSFAQDTETPPELPKEPNAQAELAYAQGKYADVLKITEKQIKSKPDDHVAHYLSASALVEIGRQSGNTSGVRQGIENARKAIELSKGATTRYFLPYLYGMTSLTELEGEPQHAKMALVTVEKVLPKATTAEDKSNLYYHRGRIHGIIGQPKKAQADFQEAIRLQEKFLAAWMGLANVFTGTGETKRARETYDEATRKFPRNPLVFNNRGLFLQQLDENELAVADFTRALQLNPQFVAAYTNRGYTLLTMGDPEAAELDFGASLGIAPKQAMVLRLRAGCRLLQKRPTAAIEDLTAALKMLPDTTTLVDLGFAKLMNRDFKEAAEMLADAQKKDPSLQHIRPWRFAALLGLKEAGKAAKEYAADIARAKANMKDCAWNDWLCGFLGGAINGDRLLAVANSDPAKKVGRLTEANFFLGLAAEMRGDIPAATRFYNESLAGKRDDLAAYRGALVSLERAKTAK